MTRLLAQLTAALRNGDNELARQLADELDLVAGPHIQFEENVLYPLVAKSEGSAFARQLYGEHRATLRGLKQIVSHSRKRPLTETYRRDVLRDIQLGLNHAESCGTLVSHLGDLSAHEEDAAVKQHELLRQQQRRWTELP